MWWFVAGIAVGGVVTLTLLPGSPAPFQWAAGRLDDWIRPAVLAAALNVVLFVPIGAIIALTGRARLLWIAPALSVVIETAQWVIPQRNPSAWDVVLNTTGAVVGYAVGWAVRRVVLARRAGASDGIKVGSRE